MGRFSTTCFRFAGMGVQLPQAKHNSDALVNQQGSEKWQKQQRPHVVTLFLVTYGRCFKLENPPKNQL